MQVPHEQLNKSVLNFVSFYGSTATKNLEVVCKQNTYNKKYKLHAPSNSDVNEISFDLKSNFSEQEDESIIKFEEAKQPQLT